MPNFYSDVIYKLTIELENCKRELELLKNIILDTYKDLNK